MLARRKTQASQPAPPPPPPVDDDDGDDDDDDDVEDMQAAGGRSPVAASGTSFSTDALHERLQDERRGQAVEGCEPVWLDCDPGMRFAIMANAPLAAVPTRSVVLRPCERIPITLASVRPPT